MNCQDGNYKANSDILPLLVVQEWNQKANRILVVDTSPAQPLLWACHIFQLQSIHHKQWNIIQTAYNSPSGYFRFCGGGQVIRIFCPVYHPGILGIVETAYRLQIQRLKLLLQIAGEVPTREANTLHAQMRLQIRHILKKKIQTLAAHACLKGHPEQAIQSLQYRAGIVSNGRFSLAAVALLSQIESVKRLSRCKRTREEILTRTVAGPFKKTRLLSRFILSTSCIVLSPSPRKRM